MPTDSPAEVIPGFVLTTCQIGAERALKQEVGRERPALRPAFARPGLVTFKHTAGPVAADFTLRSVFARSYGIALGPARDVAAVLALAARVNAARPLRLHVWTRDVARPGEEMPAAVAAANAQVEALVAALRAQDTAAFLPARGGDPRERARVGEAVLDVVVAGEEPYFVGHHVHTAEHSPWPGGLIPIDVPDQAPSRAYRKLEEALAWSMAPVRPGQVAVEIGSAPGGASYALLRRGLRVVGVDPGAMDPVVLAFPGFRHLQVSLGALQRVTLPARVDWLLLDVNLAPQVALHAVRRVCAALRPSLRGALFTLKLNDWEMAGKVPELLARVQAMGFADVRATQLPSNRQEIFVYAR